MKKVALFLFLCITTITYGQNEKILQLQNFDKKPIRYGFYLGLHQKGYNIQTNSSDTSIESGAGFQVGLLADLRLSEFASLLTEPGIFSSSNTLNFNNTDFDVQAVYFHLPVLLKLNTRRINNVRGFVLGGFSYNYNFTTDKNDTGQSNVNDFALRKHNLMGEVGIGATFYFPFFKFSPSLRGIYGFQNEFIGIGSAAKASLNALNSRGIFLNLTFQ